MNNGFAFKYLVYNKIAKARISFPDLCDRVGLSQNTIRHWFGGRHQPNLTNLIMIVDALSQVTNEHPEQILLEIYRCYREFNYSIERYRRRTSTEQETINIDREQWQQLQTIIDQIVVAS